MPAPSERCMAKIVDVSIKQATLLYEAHRVQNLHNALVLWTS